MSIKVKAICPFCGFSHYMGPPGNIELADGIFPPDLKITNQTIGGGMIDHYEVDFEDFPGYKRTNLKKLERKILKNYLERAEELCRIVESRLAEL